MVNSCDAIDKTFKSSNQNHANVTSTDTRFAHNWEFEMHWPHPTGSWIGMTGSKFFKSIKYQCTFTRKRPTLFKCNYIYFNLNTFYWIAF